MFPQVGYRSVKRRYLSLALGLHHFRIKPKITDELGDGCSSVSTVSEIVSKHEDHPQETVFDCPISRPSSLLSTRARRIGAVIIY